MGYFYLGEDKITKGIEKFKKSVQKTKDTAKKIKAASKTLPIILAVGAGVVGLMLFLRRK